MICALMLSRSRFRSRASLVLPLAQFFAWQSEQVRAALRVPQRQWDAPLATALGSAASLVEELTLCPVDGDSAHHWHDAVLYLTIVRIEQYRKSASTHLLILFLKFGLQK